MGGNRVLADSRSDAFEMNLKSFVGESDNWERLASACDCLRHAMFKKREAENALIAYPILAPKRRSATDIATAGWSLFGTNLRELPILAMAPPPGLERENEEVPKTGMIKGV